VESCDAQRGLASEGYEAEFKDGLRLTGPSPVTGTPVWSESGAARTLDALVAGGLVRQPRRPANPHKDNREGNDHLDDRRRHQSHRPRGKHLAWRNTDRSRHEVPGIPAPHLRMVSTATATGRGRSPRG
jgi:hypothetical protein